MDFDKLLEQYDHACRDKAELFDFYNDTWHDLFDLARDYHQLKCQVAMMQDRSDIYGSEFKKA